MKLAEPSAQGREFCTRTSGGDGPPPTLPHGVLETCARGPGTDRGSPDRIVP
jgi:hypothetical protein